MQDTRTNCPSVDVLAGSILLNVKVGQAGRERSLPEWMEWMEWMEGQRRRKMEIRSWGWKDTHLEKEHQMTQ